MAFDVEAVAVALLGCVCTELAKPRTDDPDLPGWVGECCVLPGNQAMIVDCCPTGGQAWVVLQNSYPTTRFPAQDVGSSQAKCGQIGFATIFEIGVTRCVCVAQDDGSDCTCDEKEQDASNIFADLKATLTGIICCFTQSGLVGCDEDDFRIMSFSPLANQGGCGGHTVTVAVLQPMPCCPAPVGGGGDT